jgi:hypothetical protein
MCESHALGGTEIAGELTPEVFGIFMIDCLGMRLSGSDQFLVEQFRYVVQVSEQ